MDHVASRDQAWAPADNPANFTGEVSFSVLSDPDKPGGLVVRAVMFPPGARTDWHYHPGGQVLYVTTGAGIVRNSAGDTRSLAQGDAVSIPAGETHWHGARPDALMIHLSLTMGGSAQWVGRKVDDAEYQAGASARDE